MQIESILDHYKDEGYGTEQSCLDIRNLTKIEKSDNQRTGQFGVFIMAGMHIVKEMFQMAQGGNSIALKKGPKKDPKKGPKVNLLQAYV